MLIHTGISRHLLASAAAVYRGASPAIIVDATGAPLLCGVLPAAPTIIGAILPRSYTSGSGPFTIDLRTKVAGGARYELEEAVRAMFRDILNPQSTT